MMARSERTGQPAGFYTRLSMLRAERGISRKALAEAVGVHYQTIGYIERAEYSPSLDLVLRIAAHFDLPVEAIFSLEPFAPLDAADLGRGSEGAYSRPPRNRKEKRKVS